MTFPRRTAALAAAALLVPALAGCSNADDEPGTAAETTAASESPSSSVEVPEGEELTEPGSRLAFGDTATVAHEVKGVGTVLELTVDSARQGTLEDFRGFALDDPYKRRGSYYYVRVTVRNAGEEELGDVPVPLWGVSGENTLLQAVEFKSSFAKCPTEPLPADFGPRDSFKTCLVFLSPNRGSLAGVSYRPTEDFTPIEWQGPVTEAPKPKRGKKGPGGRS